MFVLLGIGKYLPVCAMMISLLLCHRMPPPATAYAVHGRQPARPRPAPVGQKPKSKPKPQARGCWLWINAKTLEGALDPLFLAISLCISLAAIAAGIYSSIKSDNYNFKVRSWIDFVQVRVINVTQTAQQKE